jgi:riboflavin kinase/FMN adenylyltransferase
VVIPFDREFSTVSAEGFIDDVLIGRLGARKVSVGENFRFGAKAKGTPEMLAARPEFQTRIVTMIEIDGDTVSSTRIRELVEAGDLAAARRCLGAPFMVEGTVARGERRGRELGFPTANLVPDPTLVAPANGIYAAFANGIPAAVNIGTRPTFDSDLGLLIEAHLIDHEGDLYDQVLRLAFVERLRDEEKFDSADDLIAQMHRDVDDARRACSAFTG